MTDSHFKMELCVEGLFFQAFNSFKILDKSPESAKVCIIYKYLPLDTPLLTVDSFQIQVDECNNFQHFHIYSVSDSLEVLAKVTSSNLQSLDLCGDEMFFFIN